MASQFADDFKGYGSNTSLMTNGLYSSIGNTVYLSEDPDPNVTGYTLRVDGINGAVRRPFSSSQSTIGVMFRLWRDSLPGPGGVGWIAWVGTASSANIYLVCDSVGRLAIRDGGTTTYGQTSGPVIVANAWQHIEMRCDAGVSGTVEVRVNGVTKLTVTGVNTGGPYEQVALQTVYLGTQGGANNYKDFYVWDGSGSINNNFVGTCSVIGRTPTADVALGWTPSTGTTGWNLLDNSPPADSTDYISAGAPPPSYSAFTMSTLPTDTTSVKTLITQVRARNIDGGDGKLQTSLISGASTGNGVDRPLTTAFTYYEDVFDTDPATSAAWTVSNAKNAKLKVNRTL